MVSLLKYTGRKPVLQEKRKEEKVKVIVAFGKLLEMGEKSCKGHVDTVGWGTEWEAVGYEGDEHSSLLDFVAKMRDKAAGARENGANPLRKRGASKLLFGYRTGHGMEICSISSKKLDSLHFLVCAGVLSCINEASPSLADALTVYQEDRLCAPLLFMTTDEMVSSDVFIDEEDDRYVRDFLVSLMVSANMFGANMSQSDERKRELKTLLTSAGVVEGIIGNADEICKRGARRATKSSDLYGERLRESICAYNSKIRSYQKIERELFAPESANDATSSAPASR